MYGKLFACSYTGSLYGKGAHVHAALGFILAHVDRDSMVELNPADMAAKIGMTLEQAQAAIEFLESPDPNSRSKSDEGRRIVRVGQFLYRVVNHQAYRSITNMEQLRDYHNTAKQKQRDGERLVRPILIQPPEKPVVPRPKAKADDVEKLWCNQLYNRRSSTDWSAREVAAYIRVKHLLTPENRELIGEYYKKEMAKGQLGYHRRDMLTFLNNVPGEIDRARGQKAPEQGGLRL